MERKHKRITSVANCYTNLSRYEQAQNLTTAGLVTFGKATKAFIAFVRVTFSDVERKILTLVPSYIWKLVGKRALVMLF